MTLLKRLLTSIVLFVFLFVVIYFGICMVGGAIAGGMSGAGNPNPHDSFEAGRQAGANFVRNNLRIIVLSALGTSLISSLALSFSGVFPWCRKPVRPPDL
jgi:hypothetical protein